LAPPSNLGPSSDPDIEKQVLSDQASYGMQLGRIGEALIVLLNHVNLTNMTQMKKGRSAT
jgi:hypothetical protein